MARGWESKDVESQMEEARAVRQQTGRELSAEEAQRAREREGLELQRTRVLADLETAKNPKYREQLQRSLEFLEEKLAALDTPERTK